jgi:hypothetical protein
MRRNILILTVALIVAACGGAGVGANGDDTDTTTTTVPLAGPDDVYPMLTIEDVDGFIPVQFNLKRIPRYVLMSDGTLYTQAPITAQFPGPAVVPVQVGTVDQTMLDEIMAAIGTAGLDTIGDEANTAASARVADASTTVFRYTDAEGAEHRYAIYAMGMSDIDYGDDRVAAAETLLGLVDGAAGAVTEAELWTPSAVEVFVSPEGLGYDEQFANTLDYPLAETFEDMSTASETAGFRCTTLEGSAATDLLDTMSGANEATTFVTPSGDEYSLIVRPLLPGREGC